jgi:site-specific DNA-methyltransferase (adenine-specific)
MILNKKMEINKIYNSDWLTNQLEDGSVDLIIADPPYFEIMGDFDFVWNSFDEYLQDVERWAIECKRVLKDNGTLLWYGDDKRIAYAQIIFDKHFNLLNNLIWHKGENFMGLNKSSELRSFAPCTERILMYDKGEDRNGLYMIFANPELFMSIKKYFDEEHDKSGLSLREMCDKFGSTCSHYFGYSKRNKEQFTLPTKEKYEALQTTGFFKREYEDLRREYEDLRREYEDLRREYEDLRRPFDNFLQLSEVLKFNNESSLNTQYKHPTRKPEKLTRALIITCTKKDATILVPFAGSGTECAIAKREGRNFIGFEIDPKYFEVATKRVEDEQKKQNQTSLF